MSKTILQILLVTFTLPSIGMGAFLPEQNLICGSEADVYVLEETETGNPTFYTSVTKNGEALEGIDRAEYYLLEDGLSFPHSQDDTSLSVDH